MGGARAATKRKVSFWGLPILLVCDLLFRLIYGRPNVIDHPASVANGIAIFIGTLVVVLCRLHSSWTGPSAYVDAGLDRSH